MRKTLITIAVLAFLTPCFAQDAEPVDTSKTPDVKAVRIGQTFATQIQDLVNQQTQITKQLEFLILGLRDQAELDTTYQFAGFREGNAIFVQKEEEITNPKN